MADTLGTLHLWSQVLGKVKLATSPWLNESWHVPLYVSATGLTTGLLVHQDTGFEVSLDLLRGELRFATSRGDQRSVLLEGQSVSAFFAEVGNALTAFAIHVDLTDRPSEITGALPFADDVVDRVFDPEAARAWLRALIQVQRVFLRFRSRFVGKCSPIHLFWGSFDLAVSRFSGRPAPPVHRGGPNMSVAVAQDAYADEQTGCGFWPGGDGVDGPSFYLEAWPEPDGLDAAAVGPAGARFDAKLGRWLLSYSVVRDSDQPDETLLRFLQTGYEAVADLGGWPRDRLERDEGPVGRPPGLRANGG